jgi:UDP-N-acetyl-2-amino-2-deoxyglucuronate dehydrogenase
LARKRIAIIGLGMAVTPHAQSLLELADRVEVAAAYSPTEARRAAFDARWGFPVSADIDAIFADRSIDAVMVLTPPNTHLELTRRAAAAGKHVLLEKPLEITLERSLALVDAADAAGITLGVVLQHRFKPASMAAAQLIGEGRLGDMVSASAHIRNWRPQSYYDQPGRGTKARDGGGVLVTQAIHTLDVLVSLAGLPAEVSAYAATSPIHRMETEDVAAAALRYGNGAIGTITATTTAFPGFPETVEIVGSKGTARLEGARLIADFHDGSRLEAGDENAGGGAGADPMAFPNDHHRAVLADFLDALGGGRQPRVSGREALKVHRLIAAILRASETGRREPV